MQTGWLCRPRKRAADEQSGGKQLPVALGYDFDGVTRHLDGAVIVDHVSAFTLRAEAARAACISSMMSLRLSPYCTLSRSLRLGGVPLSC